MLRVVVLRSLVNVHAVAVKGIGVRVEASHKMKVAVLAAEEARMAPPCIEAQWSLAETLSHQTASEEVFEDDCRMIEEPSFAHEEDNVLPGLDSMHTQDFVAVAAVVVAVAFAVVVVDAVVGRWVSAGYSDGRLYSLVHLLLDSNSCSQ